MSREVALPWKRLIAELAVIVVGVLIALGMDSWWEQRQERARAEEYLQQLLVDFRETERHLRNAIAGDTEKFEAANRVWAAQLISKCVGMHNNTRPFVLRCIEAYVAGRMFMACPRFTMGV